MASRAASLRIEDAGKSGKPCARFTALCWIARRDISRMTLSLSEAARWLWKRRRTSAGANGGGMFSGLIEPVGGGNPRAGFGQRRARIRLQRSLGVKAAVHVGVAQHHLHVVAGLADRHGFDELGRLLKIPPGEPRVGARQAGVIGGQRG